VKTAGALIVLGFLFVFSPAADWLARNTPEWVGALILVIGVPAAFYGLFKLLFTFGGNK
jgi:hypothetical protein